MQNIVFSRDELFVGLSFQLGDTHSVQQPFQLCIICKGFVHNKTMM